MRAWRREVGALERRNHSVVLCFDLDMISTSCSLGWVLDVGYGLWA